MSNNIPSEPQSTETETNYTKTGSIPNPQAKVKPVLPTVTAPMPTPKPPVATTPSITGKLVPPKPTAPTAVPAISGKLTPPKPTAPTAVPAISGKLTPPKPKPVSTISGKLTPPKPNPVSTISGKLTPPKAAPSVAEVQEPAKPTTPTPPTIADQNKQEEPKVASITGKLVPPSKQEEPKVASVTGKLIPPPIGKPTASVTGKLIPPPMVKTVASAPSVEQSKQEKPIAPSVEQSKQEEPKVASITGKLVPPSMDRTVASTPSESATTEATTTQQTTSSATVGLKAFKPPMPQAANEPMVPQTSISDASSTVVAKPMSVKRNTPASDPEKTVKSIPTNQPASPNSPAGQTNVLSSMSVNKTVIVGNFNKDKAGKDSAGNDSDQTVILKQNPHAHGGVQQKPSTKPRPLGVPKIHHEETVADGPGIAVLVTALLSVAITAGLIAFTISSWAAMHKPGF